MTKNSLETQTGNLSGQNDEVNNSNLDSLKEDNCDDTFNGIDSDYIHYFYKITNKINGKYYYGIHSTLKSSGKEPLYDGYWGSGTEIRIAIQEEGRENFEKEIIEIFETRKDARLKEAEVVTIDLICDPQCYNRTTGGGYSNVGKITVFLKDHPEKFLSIDQKEFNEHPEKYAALGTGSVVVKRKDNPSDNWTRISKEEYQKNKDQYITVCHNTVVVVDLDENGNSGKETHIITVEEYKKYCGTKYRSVLSVKSVLKGKIVAVKKDDPNRTVVIMDKNDPRFLSGEYVGVARGLKQSEETVLKKTGERNGSYGSIWITNGVETKKSYDGIIPEGWKKGRTFGLEALNKISAASRKTFENRRITTTVFSKKDNKNITVSLNKSFFKDRKTASELITYEYLAKLKKEMRTWESIAKHLKMGEGTLRLIVNFYKDLGYSFDNP